jgi:hypothetical protein
MEFVLVCKIKQLLTDTDHFKYSSGIGEFFDPKENYTKESVNYTYWGIIRAIK